MNLRVGLVLGLFTLVVTPAVPASASTSPAQSVATYTSPKIDDPGTNPRPADDAAGVGSATVTTSPAHLCDEGTRQATVYRRANGSNDPWTVVKTEALDFGDNGTPDNTDDDDTAPTYVHFRMWNSQEYYVSFHAYMYSTSKYGSVSCGKIDTSIVRLTRALLFSDEFDGNALSAGWIAMTGSPTSCETYDPASMSVANGVLELSAQTTNTDCVGYPGMKTSLNSYLESAARYSNGFWMAARMKLPDQRGPGFDNSFWTNNGCGEADVFEFYDGGQTGESLQSSDYPEDCATYPNQTPVQTETNASDPGIVGSDFHGEYHVYSLRWIPGQSYQYWIDGTKVWTTTDGVMSADPTHPAWVKLLLKIPSYGDLNQEAQANGPFTSSVDWVRVLNY